MTRNRFSGSPKNQGHPAEDGLSLVTLCGDYNLFLSRLAATSKFAVATLPGKRGLVNAEISALFHGACQQVFLCGRKLGSVPIFFCCLYWFYSEDNENIGQELELIPSRVHFGFFIVAGYFGVIFPSS